MCASGNLPLEYCRQRRRDARLKVVSLKYQKAKFLATIDVQIKRAEAEYNELKHRSVSSAHLPNELLELIFKYTYAISPRKNPRPEVILSQVSKVSKRWREIAINASSLWTNIDVSSDRPTRSFKAYLRRSKAKPLDIRLILSPAVTKLSEHNLDHILPPLVRQIARWRRFYLKASFFLSPVHQILEHLGPLSAPLLEDIDIEVYLNLHPFPPTEAGLIFRSGAPRLTSVRLSDIPLRLGSYWPPSKGLKTLFLHFPCSEAHYEYNDFRLLLGSLPLLTNLSIFGDVVEDFPEEYTEENEIILPILRTLRIRSSNDDCHYISNLLFCLSAPALEILHLLDLPKDSDVAHFIETTSDEPQFPRLTSLIIENSAISESMHAGFALVFPTVKHFTCINCLKPAIKMLEDPGRWPNILTVNLWTDNNAGMNHFQIRDMVKSWITANIKSIPKLCIANKPPLFPNWFLRDLIPFEYMRPRARWPAWTGIFEEGWMDECEQDDSDNASEQDDLDDTSEPDDLDDS